MRKLIVTLVISLACQVSLAKTKNAADYDNEPKGMISAQEFKECKYDELGLTLGQVDTNRNGQIDPDDLERANKQLRKQLEKIEELVFEYEQDSPNGLPYAEFVKECVTADAKSFQPAKSIVAEAGFLIRKSHEDIDFGTDPVDRKKAKAANFSYAKDGLTNSSTLTVEGTLMYPIESTSNPNFRQLPSLSINRLKTSPDPSKKDVDTLALRYGLSWRIGLQPTGPIEDVYFRINPTFTTDTDFKADIRSVEMQLEPIALKWGIGTSQSLGTVGTYRLRPILHYEGGKVFDNAGDTELLEDDGFGRMGLKLGVEFWPTALERVKSSIQYEYLAKVAGAIRDRKLFAGTVDYQLDDNGHYTLQLKYTNGDSSLKLEDVETWSIGLGIRF